MSAPEIERIAVSLVRSHYDEELAFESDAKRLAEYFDNIGRTQVSSYVLALMRPVGTFSTMEIDPLSRIARDMFDVIEGQLGDGHPLVTDFEQRLGQYMPDFCKKAMERRRS